MRKSEGVCPDSPGRFQFAFCTSDILILIGQLLLLLLTCCALLKSTGGWISLLGEGIDTEAEKVAAKLEVPSGVNVRSKDTVVMF